MSEPSEHYLSDFVAARAMRVTQVVRCAFSSVDDIKILNTYERGTGYAWVQVTCPTRELARTVEDVLKVNMPGHRIGRARRSNVVTVDA